MPFSNLKKEKSLSLLFSSSNSGRIYSPLSSSSLEFQLQPHDYLLSFSRKTFVLFFYDLNNSLGLMQADRQTDVDIDQHLAGSAQQAQKKTQAQELQTRLFLVSLCTVSFVVHLFIVGFESDTGVQWKFLTEASLLPVWNASSLALYNARLPDCHRLLGCGRFLVFPGCHIFTFC